MMKRYLPVIFTIFAVTFTQTWASHDIPDYDYDLDGGSDNNTDIEITPPGGSATCIATYSHSCTMEACSDCGYYEYVLPSGITSGFNTCKAASCANGYTKTSNTVVGCLSLTYYTCEKTKESCLNCSCQPDIESPKDGYIQTTKRKCDQYNDCKCITDTTTYSCSSSYYQSGTTVECTKKQATGIYSCSGCTSCPSNATCNGGTNFKCNSGFYKSGNSCASCPQNSTCTSATDFTCKSKYYKSGNSCKACPSNYNTCNNDGFTCKSGDYKSGDSCKSCGSIKIGETTIEAKSNEGATSKSDCQFPAEQEITTTTGHTATIQIKSCY